MRKYGGTQYARDSRSELRRRRLQAISYVALAVLAVAAATVVVLALNQ